MKRAAQLRSNKKKLKLKKPYAEMMILDPPSLSVSQHENGKKVKAHLKKTMFFA